MEGHKYPVRPGYVAVMFDDGGAKAAVLSFLQGAGVGRVVTLAVWREERAGDAPKRPPCMEKPSSCRDPLGPHTTYHLPPFPIYFLAGV